MNDFEWKMNEERNVIIKSNMRIKRIGMEKNGNEKNGRIEDVKKSKVDGKSEGGDLIKKWDEEKESGF